MSTRPISYNVTLTRLCSKLYPTTEQNARQITSDTVKFWCRSSVYFQNQFTGDSLNHNNKPPVKLTTCLPLPAQLTNTAAATME